VAVSAGKGRAGRQQGGGRKRHDKGLLHGPGSLT
jgi:hypothetical protein